ncbi:MAG: hypothetical protein SF162_05915 [bacterium]|nr:hypothetical protein [bacterium]
MRRFWLIGFLVLVTGRVLSQSAEAPSEQPITPGVEQAGRIDDGAAFDWWTITLGQGERIRVIMGAAEGLIPLLGIADANGDVVARSDEGTLNGTIALEFTTPQAGVYRIVTTRAGLESGTSSGAYTVRVDALAAPEQNTAFGDVTFRCNDHEADALVSVEIVPDQADFALLIRVYGTDGLQPVFKVETARPNDFEPCSEGEPADGITLQFPGENATPITSGIQQAELNVFDNASAEAVTITFGAVNNTGGRYLAVIGGESVDPAQDDDIWRVRPGGLAARDHDLLLYMLRTDPTSRLDPFLIELDSGQDTTCDDAGRRACDQLPAADGLRIQDGAFSLTGGRFDAGWRFPAGDLAARLLQMVSRDGRTNGAYALVLAGALG